MITARASRRAIGSLTVLGIVAAAVMVISLAPLLLSSTRAAAGDAVAMLGDKTTDKASAGPGDIIQYAITYSCQNNVGGATPDGCDAAVFNDPLPAFTDIFGNLTPAEFVGASGPAGVWSTGFTLDASDPAHPKVTGTAGTWPPGNSGTIFVTVKVPVGVVPVAPQNLSNTATVTDPEAGVDSSTTATTSIAGTAPTWVITKIGPTTTRLNRPVTWTVSVCGASTAALLPIYTITDTLPPGALFISAASGGVYTDDNVAPVPADSISDGAGVVSWTFDSLNRPPIGADGCFRMNLVGQFPSDYVDPASSNHANDDNIGGAAKVNSVTGTGRNTPTDPGSSLGVATSTTTISNPSFGIGTGTTTKQITSPTGNNDYYMSTATTVRFNLSGSIDSDLPADSFSISDGAWSFYDGVSTTTGTGMPESFVPTAVVPGTWSGALTATIEGSNDNFATTTAIATTVASGASTISLGTSYRSIRWVWGGTANSVPVDFAATGLQIIGEVGGTGAVSTTFGRYVNTSTMTAIRSTTTLTRTASDDYVLELPQPHPGVTKGVSSGTRQPGQIATYTLRVNNNSDATGDLVAPYIEDCVPAHFTVQGAPTLGSGWSAGAPLPSCSAGATPLRFDYAGTLTPGQQTPTVTYLVMVDAVSPGPIAPPGSYINVVTIRPAGGGSFGHCQSTNPSCGARATVIVPAVIDLHSSKCVRGDLDATLFRPSPACDTDPAGAVVAAQTRPGGTMEWQLRLSNQGNTDATNIDFIDILPFVGDTAIITASGGVLNQRYSEFTTFMVSPIEAPVGWTVAYSTSANPCRAEVGGVNSPGVTCDAPNWVSDPSVLALASFRSVKISYSGIVAMGATATFNWESRAPVHDASYDRGGSAADPYEFLAVCSPTATRADSTHCPRAVNSFAYGADATNLPIGVAKPSRMFSEPTQAEVRITQLPTAIALGDRVWFDRNHDGLQSSDTSSSGEPGVAGVYVQLRQCTSPTCASSSAISTTYTDANGDYLFGSSDGMFSGVTYEVRFYRPSTYTVTLAQQVGPDGDAGDSDVSAVATGTDAIGAFHSTGPITVVSTDLTWDMGLWTPVPAIVVDKVTKDSAWPDTAAGDGVSVLAGRPVTWAYTITNTGNTRLDNVVLSDDGGPGASFAVTECSVAVNGTNIVGSPSSASAPMSLNRGGVLKCRATGTAGAAAYANTATVTGAPRLDDGAAITFASPPATVTDTDVSDYLSGSYDLTVVDSIGSLDCGSGSVPYTITVRNAGSVPSGSYQITDVLPGGVSLIAASPTQTGNVGGVVVWTMPSLPVGAITTITFTVRVADFSAGPFVNRASVTADGAAAVVTGGVMTATSDATPSNNTDSSTLVITDQAYGLALDKTVENATIAYNQNATFHVTVTNKGNLGSADYTVVDTLPAGMTPVSVSDGGIAAPVGPTGATLITWNLNGLAPGAHKVLTVVARPSDLTKRPYRNTAAITADGSGIVGAHCSLDGADAPQTGNATVDVPVVYDLNLVKTVVAGQRLFRGAVIDFDIAVRNQGTVPSGRYSIDDALPAGMSFATASDGGVLAGSVVTWTALASLAPGETKIVRIGLRLDDVTLSGYRNLAEVASDGAASYSTPFAAVVDVDSRPDLDPLNDPLIEQSGFTANLVPGDEDDHDVASLDIKQMKVDNAGSLPVSGTDVWSELRWGILLLIAGFGLLVLVMLRPRRHPEADAMRGHHTG